jgi:hypothetical protein
LTPSPFNARANEALKPAPAPTISAEPYPNAIAHLPNA